MPRTARASVGGAIYHALNRGNRREAVCPSCAERYRQEAERLSAFEAQSRTRDVALDDALLGRLASFLKSYGEMTRGEEFVMREVRARARERIRFVAGSALIILALVIAPLLLGGRTAPSVVGGTGRELKSAIRIGTMSVRTVGEDMLIEADVVRAESG